MDGGEAHDVELVGPLLGRPNTYRVAIEGFMVPRVEVIIPSPIEYEIRLDERMGFEFDGDRAHMEQTLRVVANALALGAGFSCFGKNRKPLDDFGVRFGRITNAERGGDGR